MPSDSINPFAVIRHLTLDKIDLFGVSENGFLYVTTYSNSEQWTVPVRIGKDYITKAGSYIIAYPQNFQGNSASQIDIFNIADSNALSVFWSGKDEIWNGPYKISDISTALPGYFLTANQQMGLNQVDVFLIGYDGKLRVFWVDSTGKWNGPLIIGEAAPAGSFVASSAQSGNNQRTNVYFIDNNGHLSMYWTTGIGSWKGPQNIGNADNIHAKAGSFIAALQLQDPQVTYVFFVNNQGVLQTVWADTETNWQGPVSISAPDFAQSGAVVAACAGSYPYRAHVFVVNNAGILSVFSVNKYGEWTGPTFISTGNALNSGAFVAAVPHFVLDQTDVFVTAKDNNIQMYKGNGIKWTGPVNIPKLTSGKFPA